MSAPNHCKPASLSGGFWYTNKSHSRSRRKKRRRPPTERDPVVPVRPRKACLTGSWGSPTGSASTGRRLPLDAGARTGFQGGYWIAPVAGRGLIGKIAAAVTAEFEPER
jgi:hypothetical protein